MREPKVLSVPLAALCVALCVGFAAACLREGESGDDILIVDVSLGTPTPTPTATPAAPRYFLDAFLSSIEKSFAFNATKTAAFETAVKKNQPAAKVAGAAVSAALGTAIDSAASWLAANGAVAGGATARASLGARLLLAGYLAAQEDVKVSGKTRLAPHLQAVGKAVGRSFSFAATSDPIRPSEYASYVISAVSTVFEQLKRTPMKDGGPNAGDLLTQSTALVGACAGALPNIRTFARADGTPYAETPAAYVEAYAKTAGKMIPRLVTSGGQDAYVAAYAEAIVTELKGSVATAAAANAADVKEDLDTGVAESN